MRLSVLAAVGLVVLAAPGTATAGIVEGAELEHARANARAGGPISERDAELLERYGCLSGTGNPACGGWHPERRRYYRGRRHRH
jgi:hypothetical protein